MYNIIGLPQGEYHVTLTYYVTWISCYIHSLIVAYWHSINGLVQDRRNSSVLAMELRLSCTKPSLCWYRSWSTLAVEGNFTVSSQTTLPHDEFEKSYLWNYCHIMACFNLIWNISGLSVPLLLQGSFSHSDTALWHSYRQCNVSAGGAGS